MSTPDQARQVQVAAGQPRLLPYRISGDWEGGGFAYTLSFSSFSAAHAWAAYKARFHRNAVVTVVARSAA